MNTFLRLISVLSAATLLAGPTAAQGKNPDYVFKVKVDLRNLSKEIARIDVFCEVARNAEQFSSTLLGKGAGSADPTVSQNERSYSGVISVPVTLDAKSITDYPQAYKCTMSFAIDWLQGGQPVRAPSNSKPLSLIGRSDRPFRSEIAGRLPGR